MSEYQFPENEMEATDSQTKIYSFMDILEQHKARYTIRLADGSDVILRHIPIHEYRRVLAYAGLLYPEYTDIIADYSAIEEESEKVSASNPDADKIIANFKEATQLMIQMKPITELMAIGIVTQPHVWNRDSVDAFFSGMQPDDRAKVYLAIQQLMEPIPIKYIDFDQYFYAKKFGLNIVDSTTIKDMTITQAEVFDEIFRQEKIALERAMPKKQG